MFDTFAGGFGTEIFAGDKPELETLTYSQESAHQVRDSEEPSESEESKEIRNSMRIENHDMIELQNHLLMQPTQEVATTESASNMMPARRASVTKGKAIKISDQNINRMNSMFNSIDQQASSGALILQNHAIDMSKMSHDKDPEERNPFSFARHRPGTRISPTSECSEENSPPKRINIAQLIESDRRVKHVPENGFNSGGNIYE